MPRPGARAIIGAVTDVARDLRHDTLAEARAATAEERVVLALRLGDSDLVLFCAGERLAEDVARRRLADQRARCRAPSASAAGR
jgi:hypothetical protein